VIKWRGAVKSSPSTFGLKFIETKTGGSSCLSDFFSLLFRGHRLSAL